MSPAAPFIRAGLIFPHVTIDPWSTLMSFQWRPGRSKACSKGGHPVRHIRSCNTSSTASFPSPMGAVKTMCLWRSHHQHYTQLYLKSEYLSSGGGDNTHSGVLSRRLAMRADLESVENIASSRSSLEVSRTRGAFLADFRSIIPSPQQSWVVVPLGIFLCVEAQQGQEQGSQDRGTFHVFTLLHVDRFFIPAAANH